MVFKFFKGHPDARTPTRAADGDAGYDLSSVEDVVVKAKSQAMISTGIKLEIPNDHYGRVAPRSGLAAKHSIDVLAGVIDSTFRGYVKVILYNHGSTDFEVKKGDRIAQLIFERISTPILQEVFSENELSDTSRGSGGFGSTGVATF